MTNPLASLNEERALREGPYAEGRRPDRTYVSRSFDLSGFAGVPARFVYKVLDPTSDTEVEEFTEGTQWLVRTSPAGRVQIKRLVSREAGHLSELIIQRVKYSPRGARAENILSLRDQDAQRLVELAKNLEFIPVEGSAGTRLDDALMRDLIASPESVSQLYRRDPDLFRRIITDDAAARDVIALERRRTEVGRFRRLLDEPDFFDSEVELTAHRRPEDVWQGFFEANPWVLGTGLGGQLYTSWDERRLEQVVAGSSITREGKRADALMRTSGVVRWMTFAEFKTHRADLLAGEYRPGTWPPSRTLVNGVAQAQATVRRALEDIGEVVRGTAADGSELLDDVTFLTRPRSFLVIGQLGQLLGEGGGPHMGKIRSFELFRRSLNEPEIVTFDELLARAEWVIDTQGGS